MNGKFRGLFLILIVIIPLTACTTQPKTVNQAMPIVIPSVRENMAAGTPYSLDLDAKGRIWISFLEGFVIRMDDISGAALQQFGSPGMGDWQFRRPMGIACQKDGIVVIADQKNMRIVSFDGETNAQWSTLDFSQGLNMTYGLRGLCTDSFGRIYITDVGKDRIIRIDNCKGEGLVTFGESGQEKGHFIEPTAISLTVGGEILINDAGNRRVVKIDDMQGTGWAEYGTQGNEVGQFQGMYGVTQQPDGKLLIADSHGGRIVRLNQMSGSGWVSFSPNGIADQTLFFPVGIRCDDQGRIYFIDQANKRLVRMNDMDGSGWIEFKF